jgi:starch synthase
MVRAWEGFRYKEPWLQLQQRGMQEDFSWYTSAVAYLKIYKEMTGQSAELTPDEVEKLALISH